MFVFCLCMCSGQTANRQPQELARVARTCATMPCVDGAPAVEAIRERKLAFCYPNGSAPPVRPFWLFSYCVRRDSLAIVSLLNDIPRPVIQFIEGDHLRLPQTAPVQLKRSKLLLVYSMLRFKLRKLPRDHK